ncbi:phytoene desaturase family protein [Brevibacillus borstelensis]|uniref:phytoene desaturase family protein n=1 Tax=Brevibacillus borstelensis TaxID=45462 RepID=UPI0030C53595
MEHFDVCVIGGGLSGLASAVWLAHAGKAVVLLEKSGQLGGRASSEVYEGCVVNRGPHALFRKGAGMNVLSEVGIVPKGGLLTTGGILTDRDGVYDLPTTPLSLIKSNVFTWRQRKDFLGLLFRLTRQDIEAICQMSLYEWATMNIAEERVRQLFFTLVRLSSYCDDPERASAGVLLRQLRLSAAGGVSYLHYGWQSLIDDLREEALMAGVTIRLNQHVAAIEGTTPTIKVALPQGELSARYVISSAGPAATYRMVKNAEQTVLAEWKNTLIPVKGAALDVIVKKLPNPAISFALDLERPLYFSNQSAAATFSNNPDYQVIHVFKYHRSSENPDSDRDHELLEAFLERLQPGWQDNAVTKRYLPAMTVSHSLVTPQRAALLSKESPAIKEIPGLYVVGDWFAREGLLADAALASAREAAKEIVKMDGERG